MKPFPKGMWTLDRFIFAWFGSDAKVLSLLKYCCHQVSEYSALSWQELAGRRFSVVFAFVHTLTCKAVAVKREMGWTYWSRIEFKKKTQQSDCFNSRSFLAAEFYCIGCISSASLKLSSPSRKLVKNWKKRSNLLWKDVLWKPSAFIRLPVVVWCGQVFTKNKFEP